MIFWKQRQVPLSQIKTPLLTCASWSTQGLHNRGSLKDLNKLHLKKNGYMCMDVKSGKVTTLEKISNAKKSFFDFYLKEENNDWKDTPHVIYEVRDQFIKANSNQRQRSLYLTQNIHHCI